MPWLRLPTPPITQFPFDIKAVFPAFADYEEKAADGASDTGISSNLKGAFQSAKADFVLLCCEFIRQPTEEHSGL
jgi:hypothetical protein